MAAVVRIAEQSSPHDVCVYLWLPGALDSIIALPKREQFNGIYCLFWGSVPRVFFLDTGKPSRTSILALAVTSVANA